MNREAIRKLRETIEAEEWGPETQAFRSPPKSFTEPFEFPPMDRRVRMAWAAYHGSLDAAKALHEALLPGCAWFVQSAYRGDDPEAAIEGHCIEICCANDNPARAWLIAILKALEEGADQ